MAKVTCFGLICGLFALLAAKAVAWEDPGAAWPTLGPPRGTLIIVGGVTSVSIYKDFLERCGGVDAPIVMIPTASDKPLQPETNVVWQHLKDLGAKRLTMLHTTDRAVADRAEFSEPIRQARGVFISGGKQERLANAYLHTKTHQALFDLLARDGVVAGTSAGASIQGEHHYGGGNQPIGFALLRGSSIGQHYVRRNRHGTLPSILAKRPELLGLGIDEATAVVVHGDKMEVIGESKVLLYDAKSPQWDGVHPVTTLLPGDRYDLKSRTALSRAQALPTDPWPGAGEPWVSASATWSAAGPPKGEVLVFGTAEARAAQKFIDHCGKEPAVVVISAGNDLEKQAAGAWAKQLKAAGAQSVEHLHTISRDAANSLEFSEVLTKADAVWIHGGERWKLADAYTHTLVNARCFEVLQRGGIIAGAGHGAALLGDRLYGDDYGWDTGLGLLHHVAVVPEKSDHQLSDTLRPWMKKNPGAFALIVAPETAVAMQNAQCNRLTKLGSATIVKPASGKTWQSEALPPPKGKD